MFASQMELLGFYRDSSLLYLSRNKSPVSRVAPSHWESECARGRVRRGKKKEKAQESLCHGRESNPLPLSPESCDLPSLGKILNVSC